MPCFHPVMAHRTAHGVTFTARHGQDQLGRIELPCRQCIGCRLDHAQSWAVRMTHEAKLHKANCFLTLTYSDENLPAGGELRVRDLQLFFKRLRKRVGDGVFRYYACGEYGSETSRPHYHAIVFGWKPADCKVWVRAGRSSPLCVSATVDEVWSKGNCWVGEVNSRSAGYVARYVTKKVNGQVADAHYGYFLDSETGELVRRPSEFSIMSRRPGIGTGWYDKFSEDLHSGDFALLDGRKVRVPAFYDRLLKRKDPYRLEELKEDRVVRAREHYENNTDVRLRTRERVLKAKTKSLKRI